MKKISIHQPEYLPWLGFLHKVMSVEEFVLLDNVQFEKNYFQNRNKIRTNDGWQWITVPLKSGSHCQKINEVRISYDHDWQKKNLAVIKNNYAKTEYFSNYFSEFEEIYKTKFDFLRDLNIALIKFLMEKMNIQTKLYLSSELLVDVGQGGTDVNLNISKKMEADIYLSGPTGKDYLDVSAFNKENIKVEFHEFNHPVYKQLFEPFIPNMSSIDLLFNYGPASSIIINRENKI
jgi:hypothetical protein